MFERVLGESLEDEDFDFAPLIAKARSRLGYRISQEAEIPTSLIVDNRSHPAFTILDIDTPDRIGLLYDLFDAFERLELNLELARITTEKGVAMDTFYLTRETDGGKVVSEREIRKLQRTLHEAAVSGRNSGK